MNNTQLFTPEALCAENLKLTDIKFGKKIISAVPNMPNVFYKRIPIVVNTKESLSDLIIPTPADLFSFGVQKNLDNKTYSFPISLFNKDGATPEQKKWLKHFESIVAHIKNQILENKNDLGINDIEESDLKKFSPVYRKKSDKPPMLYPKLITKRDTIKSLFFNKDNDPFIDPVKQCNVYCKVKCCLVLSDIFISSSGKVSLQLKLREAIVDPIESTEFKRLLI